MAPLACEQEIARRDEMLQRVTSIAGSSPADVPRVGSGIRVFGPATKLINLIVHDAGDGSKQVSFATSGAGKRTIFAFAENRVLAPAQVAYNEPSAEFQRQCDVTQGGSRSVCDQLLRASPHVVCQLVGPRSRIAYQNRGPTQP